MANEAERKAAFSMAEMEMEYRVDLFTRCVHLPPAPLLCWPHALLRAERRPPG
jgi:hypothetical protein